MVEQSLTFKNPNLPGKLSKALLGITLTLILVVASHLLYAQGTWYPIVQPAPNQNQGVMLLLSDGRVICKTSAVDGDTLGNSWNVLKPNVHDSYYGSVFLRGGSFINGTWDSIAPMHDTRLYFSSQILKDGRVYVAGGEFGTGINKGEVYDPITNTWTMAPSLPGFSDQILDGNSEILPDGKVLQALVQPTALQNVLYDPLANTYSSAPSSLGNHDEAAWVKLPDESILFVDMQRLTSERYIPSTGLWIHDANVPVALYDNFGAETGAGVLMPDGRAFFLGATGNTAYYTPSGTTSPGIWATGPHMPAGLGAPDGPAAMMKNGKLLCVLSPVPTSADHFPTPSWFYEFDYRTDSFIKIKAPNGQDSLPLPTYVFHFLDLPDGSVLYSRIGDRQYYEYLPNSEPKYEWRPKVNDVTMLGCDTFRVIGHGFNGISEGAGYGDDWQMATNYPIILLWFQIGNFYVKSYGWNSTGVMRGNLADTVYFILPDTIAVFEYNFGLSLIANGMSSIIFYGIKTCVGASIESTTKLNDEINIAPNPAINEINLTFNSTQSGHYELVLSDLLGRIFLQSTYEEKVGMNNRSINIGNLPSGNYCLMVKNEQGIQYKKVIKN